MEAIKKLNEREVMPKFMEHREKRIQELKNRMKINKNLVMGNFRRS